MGDKITIVREVITHERAGATGACCLASEIVARRYNWSARAGDAAKKRRRPEFQARNSPKSRLVARVAEFSVHGQHVRGAG